MRKNRRVQSIKLNLGALLLTVFFFLFATFASQAYGAASPTGCPKKETELESVDEGDCTDGTDAQKKKCSQCGGATIKQKNALKKDYEPSKASCEQMKCSAFPNPDNPAQSIYSNNAGGTFSTAKQCMGSRNAFVTQMKKSAQDCKEALESVCKDISPSAQKKADDNVKKCKEAAKESKDTEKDNKDKEKELGKKEEQNKDNAKKDESGGGAPPKMPEIPQKKGEEEKPQETAGASSPTDTASTVSTSTAPEIEVSKLGDDGIGGASHSTDTSTSALGKDATFDKYVGNGHSIFGDSAFHGPGLSGLGANGAAPAVASTGASGSGGGLGGSSNSSGSSSPIDGAAVAAKSGDSANPYEVAPGAAGRLGVPKGKTGSESDSALDHAATATFDSDIKVGDGVENGDRDLASDGEGEDPGFTIFKQVKFRYSELKKRGNI